ncbi:2-dehydro-3-deoxygalactonokinase [Marimonas arenosa]|uniref:2-dehydro-3-deoxygalactonokinase n=1 Tax=Marimonas arenosa TaxID=1795305 RepID=A0AAE4B3T4_9RHOB|nr:2-dehydro-3-deoxygalactonokinase [Marimonas arenosa]MDQ2089525.1 2-dehydro-3-deoxygalactonokinase [Marimonas arenosa]
MREDKVPAPAQGTGAVVQESPRGRLEAAARALVAEFADRQPNWDGVLCLPGDPTHWVHLSAGEIVSFQSFLTVRLAEALGGGGSQPDMDRLADTMARPERLAGYLREAELSSNRDETLGVLLGAELAAARVYWLGQRVVIAGVGPLADAYASALEGQGVPVQRT